MRIAPMTFRLLGEVLAAIAGVEVAIMAVLPLVAPDIGDFAAAILDSAVLMFVAGPLILWRIQASLGRVAAQDGAESPSPGRRAAAVSLGVLVVGVGGSLYTAAYLHHEIEATDEARFGQLAERITGSIEHRLSLHTRGIRAQAELFRASKSVERAEFRTFALSKDLADELPGALGLGYVERVRRADLETFVAAERADEAPEFAVRSSGDRPELYVTRFIEPLEQNRAAWGADIASDPVLREAADRAMLTGGPALSDRLQIMWADRPIDGFVYFQAVYRHGSGPTTPEERRRDLVGWVSMPLVLEDALAGLAGEAFGELDVELYDGPEPTAESMIFDEDGVSHLASGAPAWEGEAGSEVHRRFDVALGGQAWTLWLATTPAFDAGHNHTLPALVGASGLSLSVLLSLVVWGLGSGRVRAVALASSMAEELRSSEGEACGLLAKLAAYRAVMDRQTIIVLTDRSGTITEVNEALCRISGYSRQQLVGQTHRLLNSGHHPKSFFVEMWRTIGRGDTWRGEICNRTKDGRLYWVDSTIGPMRDARGEIVGYIAVRVDITEKKRAEDDLRAAAYTDKLTGLANRAYLCDRLQAMIDREEPGRAFAVLYLDFDRFKHINDTLGHGTGDAVIREIATRLRSVEGRGGSPAAPSVERVAGRLGGDEFVVLVDGLSSPAEAGVVVERLLEAFAAPFYPRGHELFLTVSIGIADGDATATDAEELLRRADIAMFEAKLSGRGRSVRFEASMGDRVEARLHLENDLRRALDGRQLFLTYQPIVSLETRKVAGLEALIRWRHPERGLVRPDEFIHIAEQTGLIIPIGAWVLREACDQFMVWRERLGAMAPDHVSVNLSRNQLVQQDLPELIRRVLEETGVPPSCLHLEITESAVMQDLASGARMLHAIREIGVRQSLDDFGTGHSSLASLHEFPIDILKVDRSFVANIERGREFVALVHAAVQLASNLGMAVVAEGIETVDQLAVLQSMGCEFGQGYMFSKPLAAAEVPGFLAGWDTPGRKAA